MRTQKRLALMALCTILLVCASSHRPAAQEAPTATALLERYAAGEFDDIDSVLRSTPKEGFERLYDDLNAHGDEWIAGGGAPQESTRRLAAATFALEAARAAEWLDWKFIEKLHMGELVVRWQAAPKFLEWGCSRVRSASWPDATVRLWQLGALAVAERSEDHEFLIGSPFERRDNLPEEVDHLKHATLRLPNEPRFKLAQGIALEWQSYPESTRGRARMAPGVREAEKTFEDLANDDVIGAEATVRLGALRVRLGKFDAALKSLSSVESRTRDPFLISLARYFTGQAFERKQQLPDAEGAYRSALAAAPGVQSASVALGALLAKRGARSEAEAIVNASLTARPQPLDPYRAYIHGDDRFWPEIVARLHHKINPSASLAPIAAPSPIAISDANAEQMDDLEPREHGPFVAQQTDAQRPLFSTNADLVTVGVAVRANGTPVGGLKAEDFVVLDNGVPQKVESIESESVPADVTVLVDTSLDLKEYLGSINTQLQRITKLVRPDDRLRVLGVDDDVTEILPLRRAAEQPTVGTLTFGGYSSSHDALASALLVSSDPQRRQLIIAISDTVDGRSVLNAETVLELAKKSSAELHIAWLTLALEPPMPEPGQPTEMLVYMTSAERLEKFQTENRLSTRKRARFVRPYYQSAIPRLTHDFELMRQSAEATGGKAYLPGIFTDRTAAGIFERVYDDYRHSYTIRYTPQGVKREGWHDITVTVQKYRGMEINARRGYGVDAPAAATPARAIGAPATGDGYEFVAGEYRASADPVKAIKTFQERGNPWPSAPGLESVLALELAARAMRVPAVEAKEAGINLLLAQRHLVERPVVPDEFERLWMRTAAAILESPVRPAAGDAFMKAAFARMPDDPHVLLARAVFADQWSPVGVVDLPTPASAARAKDIGALYDAAAGGPATQAEARIRKAWLFHRLAQHTDALAAIDDAGPTNDDTLTFWHDLFRGQILDALDRTSDAIVSLRAAVSRAPRSQSANIALMNALMRSGARDEAKVIAERVQTLSAADDDPYWIYWPADFRFAGSAIARLRALASGVAK